VGRGNEGGGKTAINGIFRTACWTGAPRLAVPMAKVWGPFAACVSGPRWAWVHRDFRAGGSRFCQPDGAPTRPPRLGRRMDQCFEYRCTKVSPLLTGRKRNGIGGNYTSHERACPFYNSLPRQRVSEGIRAVAPVHPAVKSRGGRCALFPDDGWLGTRRFPWSADCTRRRVNPGGPALRRRRSTAEPPDGGRAARPPRLCEDGLGA